jgi:hypothetical protein
VPGILMSRSRSVPDEFTTDSSESASLLLTKSRCGSGTDASCQSLYENCTTPTEMSVLLADGAMCQAGCRMDEVEIVDVL